MLGAQWDRHFVASTRGRLVQLLRWEPRTVEELAQALELTDNAVRAQLATLERDRLVQQAGMRRGVSKPSVLYELTPEGERLFPKAYATILGELLDTLRARVKPSEMEGVLRATGRSLAAGYVPPGSSFETRLQAATAALNGLGGLAEIERGEGSCTIRGRRCPLAAVSPNHPEMCRMAAAMVGEIVEGPVEERCDRSAEPPRCCFVVRQAE